MEGNWNELVAVIATRRTSLTGLTSTRDHYEYGCRSYNLEGASQARQLALAAASAYTSTIASFSKDLLSTN